MEYKIFESRGEEISHVDGAAFNNFSAGGQNGAISGILEECDISLVNSDTVIVKTGELLIQGFRVKIITPYTITKLANFTRVDYYLIARITLSSTGSVSFSIEARQNSLLVQDKIFKSEQGTYEIELAQFTVDTSGISNLYPKLKVISTSSGGGGYSKEEIDNMFAQHINSMAELIGGEALANT